MKTKQFLAVLLCALMLVNLFPVSAFATDETEEEILSSAELIDEEMQCDSHQGSEAGFVVEQAASPDESVENMSGAEPGIESEPEETFESEYPAFDQYKTRGRVTITVKADTGVFPADAVLFVEEVPVCLEEQAEAAISKLRDSEAAVAASYTFDIKIINPATSEEYQPAEGQTVSVAFSLAEVADENLTTSVYHVPDEGAVEKLDVSREDTVTAVVETDGFSLYAVEFTYNSLQYVLLGGSSVAMSNILESIGLSGEVSAVEISDTSLFSASNETGEWIITARQAFSTTEWMKVNINSVVYNIEVTAKTWTPIEEQTYNLTLNANYEGGSSESFFNIRAHVLPTYSREDGNYTFLGWAESPSGSVKYSGGERITLTSDLVLYAVWDTEQSLSGSLIGDIPKSSGGYVYVRGIRWRVIGVSDTKLLLISADVLGDTMTWDNAINYCDTIYSGMTSPEQAAVLDTTKTDMAYDIYGASDLKDAKLFLLSAYEALTYFSSNADRQPGNWWLRSPVKVYADNASGVDWDGKIYDCVAYDNESLRVRPAFQLNLESVLFESAAEGGKSTAAAGSGKFGSLRAPSKNGRKLTLIDSSRTGFSASVAGLVVPGETLDISYSGAETGTNEYVSAVLCDASGSILYYASLKTDGSGSGTWNMTIPNNLAGGSYTLKVFSEQQNEDHQTDYASPPVEIISTWAQLQAKLNAGGTVTLTQNLTAGSGDTSLIVPSGITVTLDLNGCTIDRGLADQSAVEDGYVIRNEGTLTITGGKITGGNTSGDVGGICNTGELTLDDVTITGNKATGSGGGIHNTGTVTVNGGAIMKNSSVNWHGGGIYNAGTLTMNGCAITDNSAGNQGGGVLQAGTMNISGATVVRDNTCTKGNNVYLRSDHPTMAVTGPLTDGAEIWVTSARGAAPITTGYGTVHSSEDPAAFFHADDVKYVISLTDGEVNLAEEVKPEFKSNTLLLSGQIGVNFYVDLSMLTEEERQAVTMDFTVSNKTTTDKFDASCTNPNGDGYYGFTCFINSVQMADEITAVLNYTKDGKSGTVEKTYSAEEYIDYIVANPEGFSSNAVALVKAIADYGHYVQPFLANHNGWTLGTDHAVMEGVKTYTDADVAAAREGVADKSIARDVGNSQIEKVTYSLNLESETAIRIYLELKDGYDGTVTAMMGENAIGCVKQSDGRYRIEISGIPAHELGEVYNITVNAGGECTISVSALSYVNTVLNSESSVFNNNDAHYAVTALYNYYAATMNYKKNPND